MPRVQTIQLCSGVEVEILHNDRSILALDKPAGWIVAPETWSSATPNLQGELQLGIRERQPWAKRLGLRFLRYVHRLDGDTSGIVLFVKNAGAMAAYSRLFEQRTVRKLYLAVIAGSAPQQQWVCCLGIDEHPSTKGKMIGRQKGGRPAETRFTVVARAGATTLIQSEPVTGRTHQIRVHLAESAQPIVGDRIYGRREAADNRPESALLGLRSVFLAYQDPFQHRPVRIIAPTADFLQRFGYQGVQWEPPRDPRAFHGSS